MTQIELDRTLTALGHSRDYISAVIASGSRDPDDLDAMDRNARHLTTMCENPDLVASGVDLMPYRVAALNAAAYINGG